MPPRSIVVRLSGSRRRAQASRRPQPAAESRASVASDGSLASSYATRRVASRPVTAPVPAAPRTTMPASVWPPTSRTIPAATLQTPSTTSRHLDLRSMIARATRSSLPMRSSTSRRGRPLDVARGLGASSPSLGGFTVDSAAVKPFSCAPLGPLVERLGTSHLRVWMPPRAVEVWRPSPLAGYLLGSPSPVSCGWRIGKRGRPSRIIRLGSSTCLMDRFGRSEWAALLASLV
jgi:hypothetical protein